MFTIDGVEESTTLRELPEFRLRPFGNSYFGGIAVAAGEVNGDGFVDLLVLDAGEQSLGVLSFSEAGRLLPITRFKVFESRLFQGGEPREFEPSIVLVGDLTGDGADDVILLCHDRVLLYPQSKKPKG